MSSLKIFSAIIFGLIIALLFLTDLFSAGSPIVFMSIFLVSVALVIVQVILILRDTGTSSADSMYPD